MDQTLVQILREMFQQRLALDAAEQQIADLQAENAALKAAVEKVPDGNL